MGTKCEAIHSFKGEQPTDLSFHKGDVFTVTSQQGNWWVGCANGRTGNFPSNYVAILPPLPGD
jgi:hypothetical protein